MSKKMVAAACVMAAVFSIMVAVPAKAAEAAAPAPAAAKGGGGPAILSFLLPGVGEWMNNDFKGSYPFAECIVGGICFPFMISSIIDAAQGATDTDIRFDFWTGKK